MVDSERKEGYFVSIRIIGMRITAVRTGMMMKNDHLETEGPSRYLCYKLSLVMRRVQRYYEGQLASFGITPVQFFVFSVLWQSDGVKFKDLAERVSMDGATLSGILDRMERAGYVTRGEDPDDRRSLLIFLTDLAREKGPAVVQLAETLDRQIKSQFSDDQYRVFLNILDQILEPGEPGSGG
jgi:MarR family transcriptional regulator, organic hydroperoxide resistance regulator